jgi:ubiquinone/menaquinone biosynthesis C-methylase UbiE
MLDAWGLLASDADCLDLGCGTGRLIPALGRRMRSVVGLDISSAMIEAARRRCAALQNVEIRQTAGRDLSEMADSSFDLVLAVDTFPYIVQAGAERVGRMVAEAARVLRPHGRLLILNFSYRGDPGRDSADIARLAAECGLAVRRNGIAPFRLWDGLVFDLAKSPQGSR